MGPRGHPLSAAQPQVPLQRQHGIGVDEEYFGWQYVAIGLFNQTTGPGLVALDILE